MEEYKMNAPEKKIEDQVVEKSLPENATALQYVEALLKTPQAIVNRMKGGKLISVLTTLLGILSFGFLAYGLIAGSFSGGEQWIAAPLKIWIGLLLTALFCFPSFYIFSCLGQADISLKEAFILMIAGLTLVSILLIGFAPVAWVFSQSTNGIAFMGFFHLIFWFISVAFGLRFVFAALRKYNTKYLVYVRFWVVIFIITSLQMMTALRPILGTSDELLPKEKKFFIEHWGDCMDMKDVKVEIRK